MSEPQFALLEVNISRRKAAAYQIELRYESPGSSSEAKRELGEGRFNFNTLRQNVLNPEEYGRELTNGLLGDPKIRDFFYETLAISQSAGHKLRIPLWLHESARELQDLRWETLRNVEDDGYLAQDENILFSRYLQDKGWSPVRVRTRDEMRALVAIANPHDLAGGEHFAGERTLQPIDVKGEKARAEDGLAGVQEIDYLVSDPEKPGRVTIEAFVSQIRKGYDIIYLVCHGALLSADPHDSQSVEEPFLWFEGEDGTSDPTRGEDLVQRVQDLAIERRPLLVVLASCQSSGTAEVPGPATSTDEGLLAALGPRLMHAGVPAVLAMQGNVSMKSVSDFMPVFFENLVEGGRIDQAMTAARGHIRDRYDWWAPVLFTRLKSGSLYRDDTVYLEAGRLPFLFQVLKIAQIFGRFVFKNLFFIVLVIILEAVLFAAFYATTELYLVPVWLWLLAAGLLLAVAIGWYKLDWKRSLRVPHYMTIIGSVLLVALVGWQAWRVAVPETFERQVYGIALAEIDDGIRMRRTDKAKEISTQTFFQLCEDITGSLSNVSDDVCRSAEDDPGSSRIEIRRVGTVTGPEVAESVGSRLNADIVIWGQLFRSGDRNAEVRFQLIEVPDRSANPSQPIVIPIEDNSIDILSKALVLADNQEEIKRAVSNQSRILSSFTLGMVNYLDINPRAALQHFETAIQALEGQNPGQILEACANRTPVDGDEKRSLVYFYLGRSYQSIGEVDEGNAWLECAKRLNDREPAIPLSLGLGYRSVGRIEESDANWDEALDELSDKVLANQGDNNEALYDRGILFLSDSKYRDAVRDFERVMAQDPDYYIGYMSLIALGQAHAKNEDFDQAVEVLKEALVLAEAEGIKPSWTYLNLAVVFDTLGQVELARDNYSQALKAEPRNGWMYLYYADHLEGQKEFDAAYQMYIDLTRTSDMKSWSHGNFAAFLNRRGLRDEAAENYLIALHEDPDNALLRTYLAETYVELNDFVAAQEAFERAIDDDDTLAYSFAKYGALMYRLGERLRSIELLLRAVELDPDNPKFLINIATVYNVSGDSKNALLYYRRILEREDDFPAAIVEAARSEVERLESAPR